MVVCNSILSMLVEMHKYWIKRVLKNSTQQTYSPPASSVTSTLPSIAALFQVLPQHSEKEVESDGVQKYFSLLQ